MSGLTLHGGTGDNGSSHDGGQGERGGGDDHVIYTFTAGSFGLSIANDSLEESSMRQYHEAPNALDVDDSSSISARETTAAEAAQAQRETEHWKEKYSAEKARAEDLEK